MAATQTDSSSQRLHLLVGQHGLWGQPSHLHRLLTHVRGCISAAERDSTDADYAELVVLNSDRNVGNRTYDGVDACGTRLADLVLERLEQEKAAGRRVVKLSFVGYSLGGLICRYAVGKLYAAGVFQEVQPMNFITVATPHLGSFKDPTTLLARFFNHNVPLVASRTGLQLMLSDSDHVLPPAAAGSARDLPTLLGPNTAPTTTTCVSSRADTEAAGRCAGCKPSKATSAVDPAGPGTPAAAAAAAASSGAVSIDAIHVEATHSSSSSGTSSSRGLGDHSPSAAAADAPSCSGTDSAGTTTASSCSNQGSTADKVPLLVLMCHPATPFYRGLAAFRQRMACANTHHDPTVPYCTAAICLTNPFEGRKYLPVDPKYPSVVRLAAAEEEAPPVQVRGKGRIVVMALLSPLLLAMAPLVFSYMLGLGCWHRMWSLRQDRDVSWWHGHWLEEVAGAADEAVEVANAAAAALQRTFSRQVSGTSADAAAALQRTFSRQVSGTSADAAAALQRTFSRQASLAGADPTAATTGAGALSPAAGVAAAAGAVLAAQGSRPRQAAQLDSNHHHQQQQQQKRSSSSTAGTAAENHHQQQQQPSAASTVAGDPAAGQESTSSPGGGGSGLTQNSAGPELSSSLGTSQQGRQLEALVSHGSAAQQAAALHEGISRLPGPVLEQQRWMVQRLRGVPGGWRVVDVCTGHFHGHAAIVIRDKRFRDQRTDLLQYIADHFVL